MDPEQPEAGATDEAVTCATAPDIAAAQVLASFLRDQGLSPVIPDVQTASIMPLWQQAISVRVQVPRSELEQARALIDSFETESAATPEASPAEGSEDASDTSPEDENDALARQAFRVAIVGCLLWPILHPYSFSIGLKALTRGRLSPKGRRQALTAVVMSLLSMAAALLLVALALRG